MYAGSGLSLVCIGGHGRCRPLVFGERHLSRASDGKLRSASDALCEWTVSEASRGDFRGPLTSQTLRDVTLVVVEDDHAGPVFLPELVGA